MFPSVLKLIPGSCCSKAINISPSRGSFIKNRTYKSTVDGDGWVCASVSFLTCRSFYFADFKWFWKGAMEGGRWGRERESGGYSYRNSAQLFSDFFLLLVLLYIVRGIGKPPITCHDMKDVTNSSWLLRFIFCFFSFEMWKKKSVKKPFGLRGHMRYRLCSTSVISYPKCLHTRDWQFMSYIFQFLLKLCLFFVCMGEWHPSAWHACGARRITCRTSLFPSTLWVLGLKFRSSNWAISLSHSPRS